MSALVISEEASVVHSTGEEDLFFSSLELVLILLEGFVSMKLETIPFFSIVIEGYF